MPRYKLIVEYDGAPFVGWQRQANGPSVQAALEAAIERLCGEAAAVTGAGRTDAGVHALGQVAHFDLAREWAGETIRDGLNFHLKPDPIAVLRAERAADDFHARFDAIRRHYRYRIVERRAPLALERGRAWRVAQPLDVAAMRQAARALVGRHDFTTFRSSECQSASPVKTLDDLTARRFGETVEVRAAARSFLHNQVRSMVGSLKLVGEGRWSPAKLAQALAARDRGACGPVAPPHGLYLLRVEYSAEESVDREAQHEVPEDQGGGERP